MSDIQNSLVERAKALLAAGRVGCFIGWGAGRLEGTVQPKFAFTPLEAEELIYHEGCEQMLGKYILRFREQPWVVGLAARGCEARAVGRLLADGCLERDKVYILGIPCEGLAEEVSRRENCALCSQRNPVIYDELLGPSVPEQENLRPFEAVEELENLPSVERYAYWQGQFDKCLRCYACRNACPACNCRSCYAQQGDLSWQSKKASSLENTLFGLTRAYHVADRCIECGECQRACPMGLPLMLLNRKLVKDVGELFGGEDAALGNYSKEDLDEFM